MTAFEGPTNRGAEPGKEPTIPEMKDNSLPFKKDNSSFFEKAGEMLIGNLADKHLDSRTAKKTKSLSKSGNLDTEHKRLLDYVIKNKPELLNTIDKNGETLINKLTNLSNGTTQINKDFIIKLKGKNSTHTQQEVRNEILGDLIEKLATNGYTEQSDKATCLMCSSEVNQFNRNPAEFADFVITLASEGKYKLNDGRNLILNKDDVVTSDLQNINDKRDPARSLTSLIYQESSSKWMAEEYGVKGSYNTSDTSWKTKDGYEVSGFYSVQHGRFSKLAFGVEKETHIVNDNNRNELIAGFKKEVEQAGGAVVQVKWDMGGGAHAYHYLCVNKIENGKVYFNNGHHKKGNGPGRTLTNMDVSSSETYAKIESMSLKDFEKLITEVIASPEIIAGAGEPDTLPSGGGYLLHIVDKRKKEIYISPTSKDGPEKFRRRDTRKEEKKKETGSSEKLYVPHLAVAPDEFSERQKLEWYRKTLVTKINEIKIEKESREQNKTVDGDNIYFREDKNLS